MSEWQKVNLGDCCEITSSKRIFFSEYVESGIPFYRSKEIIEKGKGEEISHPLYISKEKYDEIKGKYGVPQKGDLLLTAVGSLGIPFVVKDDSPFYFKDGNLVWLKHFQDIDPIFLYYWIKSENGYNALYNIAIGSAQKALTIAAIKGYEIPLPPLQTQHRIATILSRYDSLIENYQKQIKLLEEVAQRLYKEWFVDLRFPGHENTNIIDGVPEGWEMKNISGVCEMIGAGSTPSRRNNAYWDNGNIRWVKTKELLDNWIFDTEEYITEEGLNNSSTKIFPVNTILMAIYASPTLGRLGILAQECCCNQAALGLVANENLISWVWLYLKLYELRDEFNAVARGAGQQNISGVVVKNWEIIVPDKTTIEDFTKITKPYFETSRSLQSQLRLLAEARDRLLPKLMSGEITV